jgi:hypothetical protein
MNWMKLKKVAGGVVLLGVMPIAWAQSADQLAVKYEAFAGSPANAAALVSGLRNGTEIELGPVESGVSTTPAPGGLLLPAGLLPPPPAGAQCTPNTGSMGYGNVDIALSLAKSALAAINIVEQPSGATQRRVLPADICAALVGDYVTPPGKARIKLTGVLELRAQGLGWGEIANQLNLAR